MSVGTKNRLSQIGISCKAHMREKYAAQKALVEEFILEIEGTGENHDATKWSQFTDLRRSDAEMFQRVDGAFEKWLNG